MVWGRVAEATSVIRVLLIASFLVIFFPAGTHAAESQPTVTARNAVVVDATTGQVLFDKQMHARVAPASLTKIFTTLVALDSAPLDRKMTVDAADLVGESSMGLWAGEEVTLETLLYGMMLPSGNDAAMTVAQNLGKRPGDTPEQAVAHFMEQVNETAERLGLQDTHLKNPHGLDEPGHETSARDLAAITMAALENPEFRTIIHSSSHEGDGHSVQQVNRLLGQYDGLVGGKTGITDNAGYCLVEVAERDGHTLIAVVLGSTPQDWYNDARALLDYGFATVAAAPSDPGRPTITLGMPAPTAVPTVAPIATTNEPTLSVDQIADRTAVVRSTTVDPAPAHRSWRWPLVALGSMAGVLALILNYPLLIAVGSLAVRHRPRLSLPDRRRLLQPRHHPRSRMRRRRAEAARRTSRPPQPRATVPASSSPATFWTPPRAVDSPPAPSAAEMVAARAVRLALGGDCHACMGEFVRALRTDPSFDLSRCPGFWKMPHAGYVAAARAYVLCDRPADARTLATVVQLSFGPDRDLERLTVARTPGLSLA